MNKKPKRFIECLLPVTICNLKCSYCYIIQENRRDMKKADLQYSPQHIAKALSPERLGGVSFISICGAGETLIQKEAIDIVYELLKVGHYVNITTNGTITKAIDKISNFPKKYLDRLHMSFSFHYLELREKNLLNIFFDNIRSVRKAGVSILVQCNLNDEYIPYLEEIKKLCLENVGAYPQLCATREEYPQVSLRTKLSDEKYYQIGKQFNSPLFDFTMKNFKVKRKEFCYAGDWSGVLNLATGELRKCYGCGKAQNIFEDLSESIKFEAIGSNCPLSYCINSSHFMSLGIIPTMESPTYGALRNRISADWYSKTMRLFLEHKLSESNDEYSIIKKSKIDFKYKINSLEKKIGQHLPNSIRKSIRNLQNKIKGK